MNYSFAFQPIADVVDREVVSYEILLRGSRNEPAQAVFANINPKDLHRFNHLIRQDSLALAAKLDVTCDLNLNFTPGSLTGDDSYIRQTIDTASRLGLNPRQLVIEVTETEVIHEHKAFVKLINVYRAQGIKVAIDDFGAGLSGLNLLVDFQPDMVKLDMHLVRNIESHGPRQSIVKAVSRVCTDLGIDLIAEGVESLAEYHWLREQDIELYQGYLLARPGFECLPEVHYPE